MASTRAHPSSGLGTRQCSYPGTHGVASRSATTGQRTTGGAESKGPFCADFALLRPQRPGCALSLAPFFLHTPSVANRCNILLIVSLPHHDVINATSSAAAIDDAATAAPASGVDSADRTCAITSEAASASAAAV